MKIKTLFFVFLCSVVMAAAADIKPTLQLAYWTTMDGKNTVVARGVVPDKAGVDVLIMSRPDGGGEAVQLAGTETGTDGKFATEILKLDMPEGKNWLWAQYNDTAHSYQSAIKPIWVKGNKLYLSAPKEKSSEIERLRAEVTQLKNNVATVYSIKKSENSSPVKIVETDNSITSLEKAETVKPTLKAPQLQRKIEVTPGLTKVASYFDGDDTYVLAEGIRGVPPFCLIGNMSNWEPMTNYPLKDVGNGYYKVRGKWEEFQVVDSSLPPDRNWSDIGRYGNWIGEDQLDPENPYNALGVYMNPVKGHYVYKPIRQ